MHLGHRRLAHFHIRPVIVAPGAKVRNPRPSWNPGFEFDLNALIARLK